MELITEITTKLPKEVVYFDYLTMDLVPQGLLVKAKSKLFSDWIKSSQSFQANGLHEYWTHKSTPSRPCLLGSPGQQFYTPLDKWNYSVPYGIAQLPLAEYFLEEKPNLIWLFAVGLDEGTEVLFRHPISLNNWEDYFTNCCRAIQDIWIKELRTVTISASFKERLQEPNV